MKYWKALNRIDETEKRLKENCLEGTIVTILTTALLMMLLALMLAVGVHPIITIVLGLLVTFLVAYKLTKWMENKACRETRKLHNYFYLLLPEVLVPERREETIDEILQHIPNLL